MTSLPLLVLLSQVNRLAHSDSVQVSGWCADETKFSVRAFELEEGDGIPQCPGYVDHAGEAFTGKLYLAAYDKGELVQSWLVQDYPDCTSPAAAKATLNSAKAKLAELGIDLNAKGTQVPCAKSCDLGHGTQLNFENATKKSTSEDEMEGTLKGTIRVVLKTSKEKTKLLEQAVKLNFTRNMRGGTSTIHPIGYLAWNGESWVKGGVPKPYIPAPTPK